MKKRIFKFTLFKILEGIAAFGYVIGSKHLWRYLGLWDGDEPPNIVVEYVTSSLMTFLAAVCIFLVGWGLITLIKKNWEWAE